MDAEADADAIEAKGADNEEEAAALLLLESGAGWPPLADGLLASATPQTAPAPTGVSAERGDTLKPLAPPEPPEPPEKPSPEPGAATAAGGHQMLPGDPTLLALPGASTAADGEACTAGSAGSTAA